MERNRLLLFSIPTDSLPHSHLPRLSYFGTTLLGDDSELLEG